MSYTSASTLPRFQHNEPLQRPRTQPPPQSHFPKPPLATRCHDRGDVWDDSFGSFRDNNDEVSLDSWSTQRTASQWAGDGMFPPSQIPRPPPAWKIPPPRQQHAARSGLADQRPRKERDREVVLALRDDQFGQILQAISPPKRHHNMLHSSGNQRESHSGLPPASHAFYPPKMGNMSITGPPPAATLARKSPYPNPTVVSRNNSSQPSPNKLNTAEYTKPSKGPTHHPSASSNKENFPPSQSRLPTTHPPASRMPTANPFAPALAHWDSDVAMKDPSSLFSGYNRYNRGDPSPLSEIHTKHGAAHVPATLGSVRSRKEGLANNTPRLPEKGARHDQRVVPPHSNKQAMQRFPPREQSDSTRTMRNIMTRVAPEIVEIIDVDAIDASLDTETSLDVTKLSPCLPQHKPNTSSIDSTIRVERKLMNAFGDAFGTCESLTDMGPGLAQSPLHGHTPSGMTGMSPLNPNANDFEPAGKRKRQDILGGTGNGSPMSKREKGSQDVVEEDFGEADDVDMPRLGSS
jgi:hypothetical protein